jgi:peptidoglycan/xylan/chitin deacetylase (PgdA/CDA1 family)
MRAILTYHSVDSSGSVVSVEPDALRRHVDSLAAQRVRVVALEELLGLPEEVDAVAVTFDDAFQNFETDAWPILRERGHPVTLFVATDHVGSTNSWEQDDPDMSGRALLDWSALRRLAAEGVRLGAHSASHIDLSGLDDERLTREVQASADRIRQEVNQQPRTFAYPYGSYDERVLEAVRSSYDLACTTELRALAGDEDRHRLPRLDMWYFRRPNGLDGWGSASFRRYIAFRARLRAARRLISRVGRL